MQSEQFTVGDTVRYREVLEEGDSESRFVVVEDNGSRLLIRFVCNLPIPPVSLALRSDLCKA